MFAVVMWKSNYYKQVLIKLGVVEMTDKDRPDYWAVCSWTTTLQKMRYDADIAFFGNSITRGSDFQSYFPSKKIVELGYSGDSMEGMMRRMDMLRAVTPEKVFLLAGINGLADMPLNEFEQQYNTLLDSIHTAVPKAQIYVQSILPVDTVRHHEHSIAKIMIANRIIKSICKKRQYTYINIFDLYLKDGIMNPALTIDGVHLKPHAYDRWAKEIEGYIVN